MTQTHIDLAADHDFYLELRANRTTRLTYLATDVDVSSLAEGDRTCGICMADYGSLNMNDTIEIPVRVPCGGDHVFGNDCLHIWVIDQEKDTCPFDRDPFLEAGMTPPVPSIGPVPNWLQQSIGRNYPSHDLTWQRNPDTGTFFLMATANTRDEVKAYEELCKIGGTNGYDLYTMNTSTITDDMLNKEMFCVVKSLKSRVKLNPNNHAKMRRLEPDETKKLSKNNERREVEA
ncbi:hypothetical protein BJ878DRAFT_537822 [Calycina marina]|uniref:RING-type domain-containing protein n=1 Tax=Calycina marina TaxID=1763456 RepID=A0A9P8CJD9_9HELO|nr:hypothetical protein BJ878DRAFT_537822 [Calycina marina]